MDAAIATTVSDPAHNRLFRRRWTETPHKPTTCVRAIDDIELAGRALPDEWRSVRSRERMAVVAPGGERAGPPCPSGRRLDGLITT
jgi:hypothetical protein